MQGPIVDITQEMQAQGRSRLSHAALRPFAEDLPGIPWTKVVAHGPRTRRTVFIGPQVERIPGYTEEELRAEPDHSGRMIHPAGGVPHDRS